MYRRFRMTVEYCTVKKGHKSLNFSDSLARLSCSASFFCRYPILIHAQVGFDGPFGTTIVAMEMVNIVCHGVRLSFQPGFARSGR